MLNTAVFCHIAGVIFGHLLRFIGVLLLFIQNYQPQVLQGREHRRTGADYHSGLSGADPLPLVVPLPRPQGGMQYGNLIPKLGGENPQ